MSTVLDLSLGAIEVNKEPCIWSDMDDGLIDSTGGGYDKHDALRYQLCPSLHVLYVSTFNILAECAVG